MVWTAALSKHLLVVLKNPKENLKDCNTPCRWMQSIKKRTNLDPQISSTQTNSRDSRLFILRKPLKLEIQKKKLHGGKKRRSECGGAEPRDNTVVASSASRTRLRWKCMQTLRGERQRRRRRQRWLCYEHH